MKLVVLGLLCLLSFSEASFEKIDAYLADLQKVGGVEYFGSLPKDALQEHKAMMTKGTMIDPVVWLGGAATIVCKAWGEVVKAFKTSVSVTLVKILTNRGFSDFELTGSVRVIKGLKYQFADKFIDRLFGDITVPPEKQHEFNTTLMSLLWVETEVWGAHRLSYHVGDTGGSIKNVMISSHSNDDLSLDLVINDVEGTFQLAPDLYVYHYSKSVAGGIYTEDKDYVEEHPSYITKDDIECYENFFTIVNFKMLSDMLQLGYQNPPL